MFSRFDAAVQSMEGPLDLLGRLLIALLFFPSGLGKLFGIGLFGPAPGLAKFSEGLASRGVPAPGVMGAIGAVIEFAGPIFLVLGLKTRLSAFVMVCFTIMATLIAHRYWTYPAEQQGAQMINFFKNVAITGGLLVVMARGAGPLSIDRGR